jgi:hydrogenase maturation protein HypF
MSAPIAKPCRLAHRLRVFGDVQGVGFRPYVKRLADELGVSGCVGNDRDGVYIELEGDAARIDVLLRRLPREVPCPARIETMEVQPIQCSERVGFSIESTQASAGARRARIPRDRGLCAACRREIHDSHDRRHRYPFTSCVVCGPRYTVLARMPYERAGTVMTQFPMCSRCSGEFQNPTDRRHHAEVMACAACGPEVSFQSLCDSKASVGEEAIRFAVDALIQGQIVALKGIGGFQLLVRADDSEAVAGLRARKQRPSKPLAVMVRSLDEASQHVHLGSAESEALACAENPIVLLPRRSESTIALEVSPHLNHIGVLLPTTPLHSLLLENLPFPVVATSCNRGEEPILGEEATSKDIADLADAVLDHNRPILRRLDDSVVRLIDGRKSVIRLARGYAPLPLTNLERWVGRKGEAPGGGLIALGGQQKNAVALWTGAQAVLGPHIGDLEGNRTFAAWRDHLLELSKLYGTEPRVMIADAHPDYAATRWAEDSGLPVEKVFHHHAHAAAAMVEHDLLDRPVLALTWDGTGLGPGGVLWGGECLRATLTDFERISTLRPIPLPGGDAAIREPWRIAAALIWESFGNVRGFPSSNISAKQIQGVVRLLETGVQCPRASSLGRLFDGFACLILGANTVTYEGEAAAWLEAIADPTVQEAYPIAVEKIAGVLVWDWRPTVKALIADQGSSASSRAARFHNSIADWARTVAIAYPDEDVVCSGGCFQNALLTQRVCHALESIGKRVGRPGLIPVNDGGLAAGQLAIALGRWAKNR